MKTFRHLLVTLLVLVSMSLYAQQTYCRVALAIPDSRPLTNLQKGISYSILIEDEEGAYGGYCLSLIQKIILPSPTLQGRPFIVIKISDKVVVDDLNRVGMRNQQAGEESVG